MDSKPPGGEHDGARGQGLTRPVGRAHLRVGLEAAGGEHDGAGAQGLAPPVGGAHGDAGDRAVVAAQEVLDRRAVAQLDPVALRGGAMLGHQPLAAVDRAQREPAPEALAPVDLVGLALVHEAEPQPLVAQPAHDAGRVPDEDARHRLVAPPEGDAPHVGEEVVLRVGVEVGRGGTLVVDALDDIAHILEPAVREADGARRERRVAARPLLVGLLEHEHAAATLARGVRGAHAGVARARHDHVPDRFGHLAACTRSS